MLLDKTLLYWAFPYNDAKHHTISQVGDIGIPISDLGVLVRFLKTIV